MILTKEQLEKRLASEDNSVNKLEVVKNLPEVIIRDGKNHSGRPGTTNLTEQERVAIGVLSSTVGEETAAILFGVAPSTAHKLHHGMMSGDSGASHGPNQDLRAQIQQRLDTAKLSASERAAETLMKSLGLLNEGDKLTNSSAKELAQISNQMSQVVRNMNNSNGDKGGGQGGVKIILHQPKSTKESSFDTIEISA